MATPMSTHAHVGTSELSLSSSPAARAAAAAAFAAASEPVVAGAVTVAVWVTAGGATAAGGVECVTVVVAVSGSDGVVTVCVAMVGTGGVVVVWGVAAVTVGVATHATRTTVAVSAVANTRRHDPRSITLVAIELPSVFGQAGMYRCGGHASSLEADDGV